MCMIDGTHMYFKFHRSLKLEACKGPLENIVSMFLQCKCSLILMYLHHIYKIMFSII